MKKRLIVSILAGAILGIFCIIGISVRLGFAGNELFILATWVNRVVMGFVIGLAPYYKIKNSTSNIILRGAFFGLVISGSFFLATDFRDIPGFIAGIVYGIIIDLVVTRYEKNNHMKLLLK
uniref:Uncharacterized protein n=1 Tax=candidate division CPR3 bacterium TaxID=2268181 RepID=A0A7C4M2Y0_UNCC3